MHIHFSSSFGFENVYPALVKNPGQSIQGQLHLGEKGLLEFLELHLGLSCKDVHDAIRISIYKKAISKALEEDPSLYILKSFSKDPWNTARQLLIWRDILQLSNWNFDCQDSKQKRLYALSSIEEFTEDLLMGVNDRWKEVLSTIEKEEVPFLRSVVIYQPREYTHPFYIKLFNMLEGKSIEINWKEYKYHYDETDLGKFKKSIIDPQEKKTEFVGDGSLTILRAENEKIIADALGEMLLHVEDKNQVLLIQKRGHILEEALIKRGFPALGLTSQENDGALDQLFKLISIFLWELIDPEKLIQFLTIPTAPIDKKLRTRLAESYCKMPGVGNVHWDTAIDRYIKENDYEEVEVWPKLNLWFARHRYDVQKGAPVDAVISLYTDLANWADKYAIMLSEYEDKQTVLKKLTSQCRSFIKVVRSETDEGYLIKQIEIDRWTETLESESLSSPHIKEIGSFPFVSNAGSIREEIPGLIWWNFLEYGNPVSQYPNWSESEIELLGFHNLPTKSQLIGLWFWQMSHAVLSTKSHLILCIPDKSLGEKIEVNPLYSNLEAQFSNVEDIITHISFTEGKIEIPDTILQLRSISEKQLPQRMLSWNIVADNSTLEKRQESFSSLTKLFYHPHSYFLRYILGIQPVELPEIEISPRIMGTLAHEIFHKMCQYKELLDMGTEDLKTYIAKNIDDVIKESGSVFLLPKNEISLKEFKNTVTDSLQYLVTTIRDNGWKIYGSELEMEDKSIIPLKGIVDLILINEKNEVVIVDLKWGGFTRKAEELRDGDELQLIIYYIFLRSQFKKVHLLYYIISGKQFLGRNNLAFKETIPIGKELDENLHRQELIDKMVKTYNARWEELTSGMIEVGQGFSENDLKEISEIWADQVQFLPMPKMTGKRKNEEPYSDYNKIIGTI